MAGGKLGRQQIEPIKSASNSIALLHAATLDNKEPTMAIAYV